MYLANTWNTINFTEEVKKISIYIGSAHGTGDMKFYIKRVDVNDLYKYYNISDQLYDQFDYFKILDFNLSSTPNIYLDIDLYANTEYYIYLTYNGNTINKIANFGLSENRGNDTLSIPAYKINKVIFNNDIFTLNLYLNTSTFVAGNYRLYIFKAGYLNINNPCILRFPFSVTAGISTSYKFPISLKENEKIVIYIDPGFAMLNNVAYYMILKDNSAKLLETQVAIKPTVYKISEDCDGIAVYISSNNFSESSIFYMNIQKISYDEKPFENHIYLKASDNNLYQTIEKYKNVSSKYNKYYFHLNAGTYDLAQQFTSDEINNAIYNGTNDDGFVGLTLYDGMYLIGEGSKDQIIITCDISDEFALYNRRQISTLHTKGNCGAKNITFISKNIRYTVHDDFNKSYCSEHEFDNCDFIGFNISNQNAYGAGMCAGLIVKFNNCYFSPSVGFHTNSNRIAANIIFNNCKAEKLYLNDANSNCANNVRINNCDIKYVIYDKSGTNADYINIEAYNTNSLFVGNDCIPKFGVNKLYNNTLNIGNCVNYQNDITNSKNNLYGIVVGKDEDAVYIQHSGYISLNTININNIHIGDYLGIDATGNLTIVNSYNDAIAVVCDCTNENNQDYYFAKFI